MSEEVLETTYVERAERVILDLLQSSGRRDGNQVTLNQLRKILSLSNRILNRLEASHPEAQAPLNEDQLAQLYALQVQIIYQSARMASVRTFQERSGILAELKKVRSYGEFVAWHRYLEALNAYQKYYASY